MSIDGIESLYRERFPWFVQVARAIVGSHERALDAVQEGFAAAIRSRHTYRGEGPLEAWIWRAVVNAALKARHGTPTDGELGDDVAAEPPRHLLEASPLVARLPERQRLIVFLRYYAGLDYRSIAAALEIEVGTVSASLATAHAAVRRMLREVEHG
jgi:RNA polymerase sigma-70 factor (ECF subfamily)